MANTLKDDLRDAVYGELSELGMWKEGSSELLVEKVLDSVCTVLVKKLEYEIFNLE